MRDREFAVGALAGFCVGIIIGIVVASTMICEDTRTAVGTRAVEVTRPYLSVRDPAPCPCPRPTS